MSEAMNEAMNIGDLLAEQLERLFGSEVNARLLAASEAGTFAGALWQQVAAIGVTMALVPEEGGGANLSWAEVEPALRSCGRHGAPLPLGETMLGAWALAAAGLEVPDTAIAVSGDVWQLDADGTVSASDIAVAWAPQVDYLVGVASRDGVQHVCLLDMAQVALRTLQTYDRMPAASVTFKAVTPRQMRGTASIGALGLKPYLATLRSVQMAGVLDRLLALCVDYGNTRTQFGKPIGKFQAIQHMVADLAGQAASAQVAGLFACRELDSADVARVAFGAAVAKTRLGGAATQGAAIAHQVFGAIGVTDEHELHYFTRRLWQWRAEAGSEHEWSQYLGRRALDAGGAHLWDALARHASA